MTAQSHKEIPVTAWRVLPPPPECCKVCARKHPPEQPHDPESLYWHTLSVTKGQPPPTWERALAHCPVEIRDIWVGKLVEHGINVDVAKVEHIAKIEKLGQERND